MASKFTHHILQKPEAAPASLSLAQQRLWFIYQLNPLSPAYNISRAWRLKGSLDISALENSLNLILARHESLRTIFQDNNGHPVQIVQPPYEVPLRQQDLSSFSSSDLETEIIRIQVNEPLQPFNLTTGPLIRFMLLQCRRNDHVFLFSVHHIIFDGTSLKNFCQELSLCYQAALNGHPLPLPPLRIQYNDFTYWQKKHYSDEKLASQMAFWKERLLDAPLVLEVPSDRPQSKDHFTQGNVQTFIIAPQIISQLKELIQPQGITMFMALLTVFQILLVRYTGQRDILVGTPFAGRTHADLETLLGFFVNTLVLRMTCKRLATFREILQQNRITCLNSYRQSDFPFEKIVELLHPPRDSDHHPVVQTIFQFRQASDIQLHFPEVEASPYPVKKRTGNFDLHMVCEETEAGIQGSLYYPETLFSDAAMARLAKHYQTLLEALLTNPDQPVLQVSFLTEAERQQQLVDWNKTTQDHPPTTCVQQLFEEQAERTPEAIAVVFENQQLTYDKLHQRANQLAHFLQAHGVGPEVRVGVCLERSVNLVVSLLGILKAGGAYVPLDPDYPPDRLSYMLHDAQPSVLLTQQPLLADLPSVLPNHVICLDSDWDLIGQAPSDNHLGHVQPDTLAYIIYTSGSTGRPKGVLVSHRGLTNIGMEQQRIFGVGPTSRVLQFASASFDASIFEIVMALQAGATLCIDQKLALLPGEPLLQFLDEQVITVATLPPSALATIIPKFLPALTTIAVAGEACSPSVMMQWARGRNFFNLYGPTEGTIWTTMAQCSANSSTAPPIGRPIANTYGYVVDTAIELVPAGALGELFVGGIGVARGYLHRPDLTAERFVPHPWSVVPGQRLYRTGDLARYRSDGQLEFLGRRDQQIKLRGFRIELGEIETVLKQQTDVKDAVVSMREDRPNTHQLVAYIVLTPTALLDPSTLRTVLKAQLPEYMVPTSFMILEAVPLTPNGKIDRQALPTPDSTHRAGAAIYVAPQTQTEEWLAEVWRDLLHVEQIGRDDNFFELGGHSLLAMQVIARTRALVQAEVSIRILFESPTLAQFAQVVHGVQATGIGVSAPALRPRPTDAPTPLSFAQQRLWFLAQWDPENPTYHVSSAWRLRGSVDREALAASFTKLIARHNSLRTSFSLIDDQPVQVIQTHSPVALPVVDLTTLPAAVQDRKLARIMEEEVYRPFDLTTGPLFRAQLLQLDQDHAVLLVTLHHIITDGWSMQVLWDELAALYTAQLTSYAAPLPPLPIQYADFAIWQREWLQKEALHQQVNYWTRQLADAPPALEFPLDFPRPAQQSSRGAVEAFILPPALTQQLKTLSQQESGTLFMMLLAAFQLLLSRYTGQQDLLVGTPIAGRTHAELEGLIGLFVNTLAIRTSLHGNPSSRTLLRRVREICLEAYAHQDLPFEKLVEELQPVRDPSRHPVFQVMFQLIREQTQGPTFSGVEVTPCSHLHTTAKFDLNCTLRECDGALHGTLEYCTALFETATIRRMAQHFQILLEGIVKHPDHPVFRLPLLTDSDRQQQLIEWNATAATYPQALTIAELFEAQVVQTPEAVAVVFEDEQLSYKALNARANQLAHHLKKLGVGPEVLVGLCLERSLDMIVGILGILKAGGAYVPLDPDYPTDRLAYMVSDSRPLVLLTHEHVLALFPPYEGTMVCLDTSGPHLDQEPITPPSRTVTPDNLAYVIYTSGSTGRPKGVVNTHRGLSNRLHWMQATYGLTLADCVVQKTPFSFDVSVWEFFWPLMTGACLVMARPRGHQDSAYLVQLLAEAQVTTVHFVPSLLQVIVEQPTLSNCQSLRRVICSGETLPAALQARFFERMSVDLHNLYGPTEAAIDVTAWTCHREDPYSTVSIGRPIANTTILLVDHIGQLVPIGVPGELLIGGCQLARGYHKRSDLTAEKFVPHPFSSRPGERLYHTGDRARYRVDGALEFLGRLDHQVKLRGFRIELGEIETLLQQQPDVKDAIVTLREDSPQSHQQLVAYVVPTSDASLDPSTMQIALKTHIPDYMVPTSYVLLETLPMTPNGKIDRLSLPVPDSTHRAATDVYVPPQTQLEELMAEVWQDILQIKRIGRHDHFFELGGHSLLATKLLSRLRDQLEIDLPLRILFEHPTLIDQAHAIEERLLQECEAVSETTP